MIQSIERWLPVVGYEGIYEVSDRGDVRSVDRMDVTGRSLTGRVLKPYFDRKGYPRVALHAGSGQKTRVVPHLVAEAFHGARPSGMQVCHNDGNPGNNSASNLRWGEPRENMLDVVRHGHHFSANKDACPRGHALVEPNLIPSKMRRGVRECLACNRARSITKQNGQPFSADLAHEKYEALMSRWR